MEFSKKNIGIIIISSILISISHYISIKFFSNEFGISWFYFTIALMTVFSLWFSLKGVFSVYLGTLLGSTLLGGLQSLSPLTFLISLGNLFGVLIPLIVFKTDWFKKFFGFKFNIELESRKDYIAYLISTIIFQGIISSSFTLFLLYFFKILPSNSLIPSFLAWIIGDAIVLGIIGIPLLKFGTKIVKEKELFS